MEKTSRSVFVQPDIKIEGVNEINFFPFTYE